MQILQKHLAILSDSLRIGFDVLRVPLTRTIVAKMPIWDWLPFRGFAEQTKARSRRRLCVEPLEERTNLAGLGTPGAHLDFDQIELQQIEVDAVVTDFNAAQSSELQRLRSALSTTEAIVDRYKSLLFELQQEVDPLADLAPLDPSELIEATEVELDRAIDDLGSTASDVKGTRNKVRHLQNMLEDIHGTVADLGEAETQRDHLAGVLSDTA